MARRVRHAVPAFDAIAIEGPLIAPAMLAKIAAAAEVEKTRAGYRIPKGLTLRDEIARYFRIGQAQFRDFAKREHPSNKATIEFVAALLRDVFGFADVTPGWPREHDGRHYVVTLEALSGRAPIVVSNPSDDLDHAAPELSVDGRRRSPALALQDWLNTGGGALWGLCCNGERLRLMRDNASLTRPAYIEADLRQMFEADGFADFAVLWLLIHASRFGAPGRRRPIALLSVGARRRARKGWLRAIGCAMASKRLCWRWGRASSPIILSLGPGWSAASFPSRTTSPSSCASSIA